MSEINVYLDFFMAIPVLIMLPVNKLYGKGSRRRSSSIIRLMGIFDVVMLFLLSFGNAVYIKCRGTGMDPSVSRITGIAVGTGNACYFTILGLFVHYLEMIIEERWDKQYVWPHRIVDLLSAVCGLMWIVLGISGYLLHATDGKDVFVPRILSFVGMIYGYVVMLTAMYLVYDARRVLSVDEKRVMMVFVIMPVLGGLLKKTFVHVFVMPVMLTVSLLLIQNYIQFHREILMQKQEKELERARVDIMMSQISPHFVYNALNAIYSLCDISVDKAKEAIATFADYLRGNFRKNPADGLISFKQELEHVRNYLTIEKLRFADSLCIEYDIRSQDCRIPPLTVQTLVENAVRHGIEKKVGGGTVYISSYEDDKSFVIKVKDTGVGFDPSDIPYKDRDHERAENRNMGLGIDNSRYRLEKLCNGELLIDSKKDSGTEVTIIIPKNNR